MVKRIILGIAVISVASLMADPGSKTRFRMQQKPRSVQHTTEAEREKEINRKKIEERIQNLAEYLVANLLSEIKTEQESPTNEESGDFDVSLSFESRTFEE